MMTDLMLILSYPGDSTALRVLEQIKRRQHRALLMDTADFPSCVRLYARIDAGERWQGYFSHEGKQYDLTDIRSIYSRRPRQYQANPEMPEMIQAFERNEAYRGFGGILRSLDCLWVNDLDAQRRAAFKPLQLQKAAELGLRIPRTLLTNEPTSVLDFFAQCNGEIICKTLHGNFFPGGGEQYYLLHTSRVLREHLQQIENVQRTAHVFQAFLKKAFDLRCTVIGNTVLSVAIESQHAKETQVDWRASYKDLRYRVYELPVDISQRCVQLVQQLGLVFGALDLLVTPEGEYVFLEVNPGGQWEWLEQETKLPFSATLAEVLITGQERKGKEYA